ncbi:hypothetical protein PR048_024384 [Dryococelus australis]|uniref:Uncharacterized protein n=1 Tax=Dryococelus australis TaxID=614101 RepID=A0ABQ9GNG3_9NEOP|nr:hypothetical protein PR048_024384 [Dryococelus australis]
MPRFAKGPNSLSILAPPLYLSASLAGGGGGSLTPATLLLSVIPQSARGATRQRAGQPGGGGPSSLYIGPCSLLLCEMLAVGRVCIAEAMSDLGMRAPSSSKDPHGEQAVWDERYAMVHRLRREGEVAFDSRVKVALIVLQLPPAQTRTSSGVSPDSKRAGEDKTPDCELLFCATPLEHRLLNFTVLYVPGPATSCYWLLHRCQATPFLNELHMIGLHNCKVFNDWRSVTQRVSDTVSSNGKRIAKVADGVHNGACPDGSSSVNKHRGPPLLFLQQARMEPPSYSSPPNHPADHPLVSLRQQVNAAKCRIRRDLQNSRCFLAARHNLPSCARSSRCRFFLLFTAFSSESPISFLTWLDLIGPTCLGGPIVWPPRYTDLTPLDLYLWGHVKSLVYDTPVNTREEKNSRSGFVQHWKPSRTRWPLYIICSATCCGACIERGGNNPEQLLCLPAKRIMGTQCRSYLILIGPVRTLESSLRVRLSAKNSWPYLYQVFKQATVLSNFDMVLRFSRSRVKNLLYTTADYVASPVSSRTFCPVCDSVSDMWGDRSSSRVKNLLYTTADYVASPVSSRTFCPVCDSVSDMWGDRSSEVDPFHLGLGSFLAMSSISEVEFLALQTTYFPKRSELLQIYRLYYFQTEANRVRLPVGSPPDFRIPALLHTHTASLSTVLKTHPHFFTYEFAKGDKIDVKHVYIDVDFAIGSQFIRHSLDESEPIANQRRGLTLLGELGVSQVAAVCMYEHLFNYIKLLIASLSIELVYTCVRLQRRPKLVTACLEDACICIVKQLKLCNVKFSLQPQDSANFAEPYLWHVFTVSRRITDDQCQSCRMLSGSVRCGNGLSYCLPITAVGEKNKCLEPISPPNEFAKYSWL